MQRNSYSLLNMKNKITMKEYKERALTEHEEQKKVMAWVDEMTPHFPELGLLFAVPNGGFRHKSVAIKMKAEGVRAGVSDLMLPVARRGFYGLFLEMKAIGGKSTPKQSDFLKAIFDQGYCPAVGVGAQNGIDILRWYLGMTDLEPEGCYLTRRDIYLKNLQ